MLFIVFLHKFYNLFLVFHHRRFSEVSRFIEMCHVIQQKILYK